MSEKLEHNALPNLQELQQFQEGLLSAERMREIRAIADENPLLRESLEGYAASGVFLPMPTFEQTGLAQLKIAATAGKGAASAAGWKLLIQPWAWSTVTKIMVGVTVATGLLVGVAQINGDADTQPEPIAQQQGAAQGTAADESVSNTNTVAPPTSVDAGAGNQSNSNATAELNDGASSPSSTNETTVTDAPQTPIPNEMQPIEPSMDELTLTQEDRIREQRKGLIMVGMTEILKYRVADYTDVRREKWSNVVFSEGHTPANQEKRGAIPKEQPQTGLRYLEYVGHCIAYLDKKQYQQAREGFDALLKLYADDVNAQFYGALACYRSGEFAAAIPLFKMTEGNAMRAFREDAKFYRAMAMKSSGQGAEAKVLFEEIAASGGSYAKRALEELN